MKTTRRQFIKSLFTTVAAGIIAPQVLVESVHGASDLTARERDVAADVMGLREKQWSGVDLGQQKGADKPKHWFDAMHYAMAYTEPPAMLFGYPIETGTFRQSIDGLRFEPEHKHRGGYHRGGYLVSPDATRKIVEHFTLGLELLSRTESVRAYGKSPVATAIKKEYKRELVLEEYRRGHWFDAMHYSLEGERLFLKGADQEIERRAKECP